MNIRQQIKARRLALGIQQKDMQLRIGMNRQQYQQIESSGNPRLETLDLIAKGIDAELVLIPNEYLTQVKMLLKNSETSQVQSTTPTLLSDDPWKGISD